LNPLITQTYDWLVPAGSLGDRGERLAERHLLCRGYYIIERGYQNSIGEIDLIAVDGRTVVFVEVKTRSSDIAGLPAEAVDETKQQKIVHTATSYLKHRSLLDCQCRFDVVSIMWPDPTRSKQAPQVDYFKSAFTADESAW
jgi:putative endonuclease